MEKGVRGEFSKQTHSDKKNVHSAERKQSQSFKANNKPDMVERFSHLAETTDTDSVSETDNERELLDSEQNSLHSAENSSDKPDTANGEKEKLIHRKRQKHEVKLLSQTL